jgi:Macrocin-O-methyltransferase (TylF)
MQASIIWSAKRPVAIEASVKHPAAKNIKAIVAEAYRSLAYSATAGVFEGAIRRCMFSHDGRLRTTKYIPWYFRRSFANHFASREWAEIALIVANQYPGGDYFEFGSEGFRTFRNFLSAFHLNGHSANMPDVKFFAFDVFGEPKSNSSLTETEQPYFAVYRGLGSNYYRKAEARLRHHDLLLDRCVLVKGHFQDTLNQEFKARLRAEDRRVGFAFLDCNIASSYKTCFDFLLDFMREDRAFIYMDEYFQIEGVADLFDDFCRMIRSRHGLRARYVRDAGAFGALFVLMGGGEESRKMPTTATHGWPTHGSAT